MFGGFRFNWELRNLKVNCREFTRIYKSHNSNSVHIMVVYGGAFTKSWCQEPRCIQTTSWPAGLDRPVESVWCAAEWFCHLISRVSSCFFYVLWLEVGCPEPTIASWWFQTTSIVLNSIADPKWIVAHWRWRVQLRLKPKPWHHRWMGDPFTATVGAGFLGHTSLAKFCVQWEGELV